MASSLRSTLRRAVELALLGAAASTACTSSTETVGEPAGADAGTPTDAGRDARYDGVDEVFLPEAEASFTCPSPQPPVLPGLTPAKPWDYVELRRFDPVPIRWRRLPTTVSKLGTPCATASDPKACADALALPADPAKGWSAPVGAPREQLVVTRGDEVLVATTTAEVAALLAPIDTPEEALLLLATSGVRLACRTTPAKSGLRKNADGSWDVLVTGTVCAGMIGYRHHFRISREGAVTFAARDPIVAAEATVICGRRPSGLVAPGSPESDPVAAYFARCAHLEAASVVSFRRLEVELRALGAPDDLLARARRSRHDEIAHAREMSAAAHAHGATVPAVEVEAPGVRSAFDIALENAVEGCVLETYGAALAAYQAERAPAALRPLFGRIAEDELRHAELAHAVAAWLEPRLTPDERTRVSESRRHALARLLEATKVPPDEALASAVGLPSPRAAQVLATSVAHLSGH